MKLLTKDIREKLLRNGRITAALAEEGKASADFVPVVKLFTPDANCTWLLTELDPEKPDIPLSCGSTGGIRRSLYDNRLIRVLSRSFHGRRPLYQAPICKHQPHNGVVQHPPESWGD